MNKKIEIGDEVQFIDGNGAPRLGTRFIVTSIGTGYMAGIDFCGDVYEYTADDGIDNLEYTGRHFDILGALFKLRDGED